MNRPYEALARRVAQATQGRSVLVIASRVPADALWPAYEAAGADLDHVHILDATGTRMGAGDDRTTLVNNPSFLEMIASRADRVLRRSATRRITVVTDCLATFSQYNPTGALQQILRYSFNYLMTKGTALEYAATPTFQQTPTFHAIQPLFDEVLELQEDGEAVTIPA